MSIRLVATISAMTIATALTVSAQTPYPQTPQTKPQTPAPTDRQRPAPDTQGRANTSDRSVTVTGCLQAQKDVPGHSASAPESGGMGEDHVLTNVKMSQGASTSGIGLAAMYQIKGGSLKDSELKNHLGHQVEITGRLQNTNNDAHSMSGRTGATSATGRTSSTGMSGSNNHNSNLQNLQATSLKMIANSCPAQ